MRQPAAAARGVRFHAGLIGVAILLALAETWPLATELATHFPVQRPADGAAVAVHHDQLLIAWILTSDAQRLARDPLHVFDTNNMHPFRHTLAYSENLLGLALPVWPVHTLWSNPVLTANLALLVALVASAYGVQLLVHELTGSAAAAVVAATLATYAPIVWGRIDQMHVTTGAGTALAFFAMIRVVRTRRWRHGVLLGAVTAWQVWASLHWGVFLALGLGSAVLALLLIDRETRLALPQLALAGVLAAAITAPLALPYLAVAREMDWTQRGFVAFLGHPNAAFPPLRHPLAYLTGRLASGERLTDGTTLAAWLAIVAGVLVSWLVRRPASTSRAMLAAVAVGLLVNYWFACGALPQLGLPSLRTLLLDVPGIRLVRVPARAMGYVHLMLAVLAGCGVAAVLRRLARPAARAAVVIGIIALAVVEAGWRGGAVAAAPSYGVPVPAALAGLPPSCAVAEVPSDFTVQALALFRSIGHGHPLLNGRSGFYPVSPFVETQHLNLFPSDQSLEYLRAAGVCAAIVRLGTPASQRVLAAVRARGLRLRPLTAYDAALVVLPPGPGPLPAAAPLARSGWRIVEPPGDATMLLDGSLDTRRAFRVTGAGAPERLTIDTGRTQQVSGVDLVLGTHFRDYLWSYRVEGSEDGTSWTTLAEQANAIPPFESYRTDPQRIVQRIRFAPAQARYVRIGPYRIPPTEGLAPDAGFRSWGAAEIELIAPEGPSA